MQIQKSKSSLKRTHGVLLPEIVSRWRETVFEHPLNISKTVDETPRGYAAMAAFQSSDRSFLQYRGFGYLHSRVLSDLQFGIERLEEELDALDQYDKDNGRLRWLQCTEQDRAINAGDSNASAYEDEFIERSRPVVLRELKAKLLEYDEMLLKTKEMATLQRPAKRDYESVKNFFINFAPTTEKESRFIRRKEDIVTLRSGRESATFDGLVETGLNRIHKFLERYFKTDIVQVRFAGHLDVRTDLFTALVLDTSSAR